MCKVAIITLGCKQNKYESDCMARILRENGYDVTEEMVPADIYILNTCAVTNEAEKKSRQHIVKFKKLNKDAKIIVCGCSSQNNIDQYKGKDVFSVFGTEGKQHILDYLNVRIFDRIELSKEYNSPVNPDKFTTREYLKIQDGCNNFCSYCLIPYLRGRSRSRKLEDIIEEGKILASRSKEIVITGIDISSYSINGKPGIPMLMSELDKLGVNIRLGSLEVNVITEELMEVLKGMKNFAPHFHLSLQSGDDNILKKMNRHYTRDEFYEKVCLIRKYFPLANLTTDVIVGFAGESEEEFYNTREFISKVGFSYVHIFPYSKRLGTVAYKFDDLSSKVKKARLDILEILNEKLKNNYLDNFLNKKSKVIVEEKKELYEGFSTEYIRCYFDEDVIPGKEYKVKFIEKYLDGMKVKVVK